MNQNIIDFKGLAGDLLSRSLDHVSQWLPDGKQRGNEYVCGSLHGGRGDSLSINLQTGKWADFATTDKGGDLISLYAAIKGIKQIDAARQLASGMGFNLRVESQDKKPAPPKQEKSDLVPPPPDAPEPEFKHELYGNPSSIWNYNDLDGRLLFYIARYDYDGKKNICPWSWNATESKWVRKAWAAPRPLYGLPFLSKRPKSPVLIVEGEKAADAAHNLLGHIYCVVTWPNGAQAYTKADWSPIYGRTILIWPDADGVGIEAGHAIAQILYKHCPQIKILKVDDKPEGWDAADAIEEGLEPKDIIAWAQPNASIYAPPAPPPPPKPKPEPTPVLAGKAYIDKANVVANEVHIYEDGELSEASDTADYWQEKFGLATNGRGGVFCNMDNLMRVLQKHEKYSGKIWFDDFRQSIMVRDGDKSRPWSDDDALYILLFMQRQIGMAKTGKDAVYDAATAYAKLDIRNEAKDWMESLVWDGTPRIDNFFRDYYVAEDSEYTRSASKNFWISLVARTLSPGCKVDNMVILEGSQGLKKSTSLRVIGGSWFTEVNHSVSDSDIYYSMRGKILMEFGELNAFSKAETSAIKKFLSNESDNFRPVWGRTSVDFPRRTIFVGTTNEDEYLQDSTGQRRFWPIKCGGVNLDDLKRDRDQLFAEAVHRFKAGDSWWEMPDSALEEQEKRRMADAWERVIKNYLLDKHEVSVTEIAIEALQIPMGKIDQLAQKRIAKALKLLGWVKHRIRKAGALEYVFVPPHSYGKDVPEW